MARSQPPEALVVAWTGGAWATATDRATNGSAETETDRKRRYLHASRQGGRRRAHVGHGGGQLIDPRLEVGDLESSRIVRTGCSFVCTSCSVQPVAEPVVGGIHRLDRSDGRCTLGADEGLG